MPCEIGVFPNSIVEILPRRKGISVGVYFTELRHCSVGQDQDGQDEKSDARCDFTLDLGLCSVQVARTRLHPGARSLGCIKCFHLPILAVISII